MRQRRSDDRISPVHGQDTGHHDYDRSHEEIMASCSTRMLVIAGTIALTGWGGAESSASAVAERARQIGRGTIPAEVRRVETRQRLVALTFDDGPDPSVTPQVLTTLQRFRAQATFFLIGAKVEVEAPLAKRILREGHEVGNHTLSHVNLTRLDAERCATEWKSPQEIFQARLGITPTISRPPGGQTNAAVRTAANALGMTSVLWSVNPGDCDFLSSEAIVERVLQDIRAGDIVLLHDTVPATANALPRILQGLRRKGLRSVSVSELLRQGK
jgi:peptidoglycan/xylan/chitin deacetylase (PgdA/CDA1 family)